MKRLRYMVLVFVLLLGLTGCGLKRTETDKASAGYVQYFVNEEETKLLQDAFKTEKTEVNDLVASMTDTLQKQENSSYVIRLLPEDVSILSVHLDQDVLTVNLSSAYRQMNKTREILTRAGLVKSFTQFEGIQGVRLEVEGQDLTDQNDMALGVLTAADFVEGEGREIDAYQYGTFTLYFSDASGKKLVQEKQKVYYSTSVPKEREVVELLLHGPLSQDLKATLPSDLKILSVTLSDGIVYVNLDPAFLNGTSEISEKVVVYSLVNSLLELEGTSKVQISVNGETKYVLGDGIDLSKFLTKNTELIGE